MDGQAKNLEAYLRDLLTLVKGRSGGNVHELEAESKTLRLASKLEQHPHPRLQAPRETAPGNAGAETNGRKTRVTGSSHAIPFEEDEMESF